MLYELDPSSVAFPYADEADENGLLAIGGDLSASRLLNAYASGIFPWYDAGEPIMWWSLNPRILLFPNEFRLSKSLRRTVRAGRFEVRVDTCFEAVMRACATAQGRDESGTWISEEMVQAYVELHRQGFAHSFETFEQGRLAGGLYGVSLGDLFFGESMFHWVTDASKVAFAKLVEFAALHGFRFIDAQQETAHLASLGARPVPRRRFLDMLDETPWQRTLRYPWPSHTAVLLLGGNQGDRERVLGEALRQIGRRMGHVARRSALYETAPWGFEAEQDFLNQAVAVDTALAPHQVLQVALDIERGLGRRRDVSTASQQQAYASRPIDIDIIFYDSQIIDTPTLQVPHPRMAQRRFVLRPLCDIMPHFEHPTLHKTMENLLATCADTGVVTLFKEVS